MNEELVVFEVDGKKVGHLTICDTCHAAILHAPGRPDPVAKHAEWHQVQFQTGKEAREK